MDASAGERPHSTTTHTGIKEEAVEGNHEGGAVPNAMQCRERVSRVFFTRNSRESIRVVAATAISMSPEGMRVPENVLNSTAILVGSQEGAIAGNHGRFPRNMSQ